MLSFRSVPPCLRGKSLPLLFAALLLAPLLFSFAAAPAWNTVFEQDLTQADLTFGWAGTNWLVRAGSWEATPQGLHKISHDDDGLLLLRYPAPNGDVRVTYEAMSPTPGDMSLFLGLQPNTFRHFNDEATFLGFATRGNTASRLALPRGASTTSEARATPGAWHQLVVTRDARRLTASVDGRDVLTLTDTNAAAGAGPFLGLYAWNETYFRSIRVESRQPLGPRISFRAVKPPPTNTAFRPIAIFVAPNGNDAWSGALADPSPAADDGPLATVAAGVQHVRDLIKSVDGLPVPVTITLRGGTYPLTAPILIPTDAGGVRPYHRWLEHDPAVPVTIRAYPGESPVISGGRRIANFAPAEINGHAAWAADLPDVRDGRWTFTQLWVNGERRARPRLPRTGTYRVAAYGGNRPFNPVEWEWIGGDSTFHYQPGNIDPAWRNLADIDIVVFNFWIDSRMRIAAVDPARNLVTLDRPCKTNLKDDQKPIGAEYWIENVREALAEPGEWYLDRAEGRLYYLPLPGERIDTAEVIAPVLPELLRVAGDSPAAPVTEFHLEGLTFAHTEWLAPTNWSASNQAAYEVPAALLFTNAVLSSIKNCRVEHVGGYGIEIAAGSRDITVARNHITDLGAGGLRVWHGASRALISDNVFASGGHLYHAGVGILIGNSGGNRVLHNAVHDFDYSAVSVGWTWGYGDNAAAGNIVEYNHLYNIGNGRLSDAGGIYTLGIQPGTRLRYNRIHDVVSRTYGGWGIYLDEGSSDMLVENNLAYRCKTGGFNQHYGRDNEVRNNIFAFATTNELARGRDEIHASFNFERNIVVSRQGLVWLEQWPTNSSRIANNLYWRTTPGDLVFTHHRLPFAAWQALGLDAGTRIADPRFADAAAGDFTLPPDSPALDMGFIPFDLSTAGPRP